MTDWATTIAACWIVFAVQISHAALNSRRARRKA